VSDYPSRTLSVGIGNALAALADQGYLLVSDQLIGLPNNFRQTFLDSYFNDDALRHDDGDWPVDRKRARDVVRYQWRDGSLQLREHDTIIIKDRAGIPGDREHKRVWLLGDPRAEEMVRTFLSLIPVGRRQADSTFGVNLFRTYTNVVTKPHRDDEEFVIIYVLDRMGGGAESYLYEADVDFIDGRPAAEPVLRHQLNPGDILIFDDERFIHDASKLEPLPDGTAQRDVLVCTVDYRDTYLKEAQPAAGESVLAGSGVG
jgi:hypothetical protein